MSSTIAGRPHSSKNKERMKKLICRAGIPLAVIALTWRCAAAGGAPAQAPLPQAPAAKTANLDEYDVARSTLGFGADLYRQLAKEPGNLFFSPYSIVSALATVYGGARGKTADEMSRVLQLNVPAAAAASGFKALRAKMKIPKDEGTLTTADSLWTERTFPFKKEFVAASLADYGASAHIVDFLNRSEEVRSEINGWVQQITHDKIKDLIGPGGVGASTRLVVCSAIYFKAGWDETFDADFTRP
jgi:serpin B